MLLKSFKHNPEGKALAGGQKICICGCYAPNYIQIFRLTTSAGGELLQLYQKGNLPHQN